jgi:hypothetical protein
MYILPKRFLQDVSEEHALDTSQIDNGPIEEML